MSERKRVWGLYTWGSNEWWVSGNKRMRFDTPEEAFNYFRTVVKTSGDCEGYTTGIRPFYIVSKSKLPDDVKELIAASRDEAVFFGDNPHYRPSFQRFLNAVRALDGKY